MDRERQLIKCIKACNCDDCRNNREELCIDIVGRAKEIDEIAIIDGWNE